MVVDAVVVGIRAVYPWYDTFEIANIVAVVVVGSILAGRTYSMSPTFCTELTNHCWTLERPNRVPCLGWTIRGR
jgi:hypothetical protein